MKNRNNNIEYLDLTQEDEIEYKKYAKKRLKICTLFFGICFPIFVIFAINLNEENLFIWISIAFIIYVLCFFSSYIIHFMGKPIGVRYGKVSKKISVRQGKYSGYRYNIYFKDINKSLTNAAIIPTKEHPTISVNNKVKVFKSKFGVLYIVVYK